MDRIEIDLLTGVQTTVPLTPGEVADLQESHASGPVERSPSLIAQLRLLIVSDVVEGASTDGGLASCSVLEAGLLWCEFPSPVDGEYLVWPSNGRTHRCYSLAEEQFPEGFAVRSESYEGGEGFPERLQILVTKS